MEAVNDVHKTTLFSNLSITVCGLAFKPNTNDMREAPSCALMEALWQSWAIVQAYDLAAVKVTVRIYVKHTGLTLFGDKYAALQSADALVNVLSGRSFARQSLLKWRRA